ncbi:MAG: GNAT family N-acetyltransferase [Candidatus Manganitrophus sp.]|nr:GNAT family N-acetyltransferase [Candidatus Manganitrophus sp.]
MRDRFPHPYTLADAEGWIEGPGQTSPQTQFAIVLDGEAIGGIGFELREDVFRRSAEIGYWLGEPFWGRGIMTEALRAVTEYAFKIFNLCRIEAGVFEWNPAASMRGLEKAGYVREARLHKRITKDGRTIDQFLSTRWFGSKREVKLEMLRPVTRRPKMMFVRNTDAITCCDDLSVRLYGNGEDSVTVNTQLGNDSTLFAKGCID